MVAFSRINGAIDLLFHQINPLANGRRLMESSVLPERMLKSDEFRSKGLIFVGLFRIGRSARGRFSRICSVLKGCKVADKIGGGSKLDLKPISLFDQRVSTSNLKLSLGSKSSENSIYTRFRNHFFKYINTQLRYIFIRYM